MTEYPAATMATYAVHMRIEGVRPKRSPATAGRPTARFPTTPAEVEPGSAPVDLVGRPLGDMVAERWMRIREACGQMTFFLFDPDSWR